MVYNIMTTSLKSPEDKRKKDTNGNFIDTLHAFCLANTSVRKTQYLGEIQMWKMIQFIQIVSGLIHAQVKLVNIAVSSLESQGLNQDESLI